MTLSDERRAQLALINNQLLEKVLPRTPGPGDFPTAIPGLTLHRRDETDRAENCFHRPIFAVTLQGAKRTVVGTREYRYGAFECLLSGVDMPSVNHITEASPEKPYLVVSVELDNHLTTQLASEMPSPPKAGAGDYRGTAVGPVVPEILDALLRLTELLDNPEQIPVLAPMFMREIHYRLLTGPQGEHLRLINTLGTQSNRIFKAITRLREQFREHLELDDLAGNVNMAPSTFRRYFRNITTMSPLQYQKQMRLHEAQRLMLVENSDALHAGYAVGYESPTQFHREYKRLFGEPPQANVSRLR